MTSTTDTSCAALIGDSVDSRMTDLKVLYRFGDCDLETIQEDEGIRLDDDESRSEAIQDAQSEYGLHFDFQQPENGENGYWCFLLSTGGPHEEIRFYGMENGELHSADFVRMDWGDSAKRSLSGDALDTAKAMFSDFADCGTLEHTLSQAA